MNEPRWRFSIDVGGTFTDVVAFPPAGPFRTYKLLSSGVQRGVVEAGSTHGLIRDSRRRGDPSCFWAGYEIRVQGVSSACGMATVTDFDKGEGVLRLDPSLEFRPPVGSVYELRCDEEAPIIAIRYLMGLGLHDEIGPIEVRLGTTRATNALLERKGARVLFVTTKGLGDVLKIGYQDRSSLFSLNIRKRDELAECVLEVDERLDAVGNVLIPVDPLALRRQFTHFRQQGLDAVAICLMHAHVNPRHERVVEQAARDAGFSHVSVSSQVSRVERIVARGDTTLVDAYLGKVIEGYVRAIRHSLPEARLRLMTSAGGLVAANSVQGKDTILSGPAGGVVGCAYAARQAKLDQIIGFDMGGTSTDVCRIHTALPQGGGSFTYEHETIKAGVRIVTPMLAVETVAAGGGSICAFDGQMLTVGPHSAGAEPGPACYGHGGPLTVTDINLFLGRLDAGHFPFLLDPKAVVERLTAVRNQVEACWGSAPGINELAEGFLNIANTHMAAAIKRISVARGFDLRDYVLFSFGGAGGQHACGIARMLGMRKILLSPFSGVLSALGIAVAEIRRVGQRSVRIPFNSEAFSLLEPIYASLRAELQEELKGEYLASGVNIREIRIMDLCYVGQGTFIPVLADPPEEALRSFEASHLQQYGFIHEGRAVEVRVVRLELSTSSQEQIVGGLRETPAVFEGSGIERKAILGPALIPVKHGSLVVDADWKAEFTECGDIFLTDIRAVELDERVATEANPIHLELFNNRFAAIAEQMGVTLRRTALSVNVKERLDFSCAIFDSHGNLVVNAPHIPVHLGGMSDCVKALIEDVGEFAPGDVYVTNDPYRGGSHLNDVTVITPVFQGATQAQGLLDRTIESENNAGRVHPDGSPTFFVANRAHHAEIGGTRPGSMPPSSRTLAEEGVLIRAFPLIKASRAQFDALRLLLVSADYPSRAPDDNLADLTAQVAANQTGVQELHVLAARHGLDGVQAYMRHIQKAAEHKMRRALAKLNIGVHPFEDRLDDGTTIRLVVTIRASSERDNQVGVETENLVHQAEYSTQATFDFTGTDPAHPGNLNANRSIVTSALLYCLRCLIEEDIPLNAGVLAPVGIILPECFLNPSGDSDPTKCPAIVGGNVETSQRIVDVVFGALGVVAASQGTMNNLLMGNAHFGYYETICGGSGAGPGFDGVDAVHAHMTNTRLTDPEILESRYPVRLIRFCIRTGSGGAGAFRGGCGVIRELEFLEALDVSLLSQRRTTVPYGLFGGSPGVAGRNLWRRKGSRYNVSLDSIVSLTVSPGDRITIETPGGGGYGPVPKQQDR